MSQNMEKKNIEFVVDVNSAETITVVIEDNAGNAIDLTNTTTYATVQLHVWQPNGNLIISSTGSYGTRNLGQVQYTFSPTVDTVLANAGNWQGQFVCYNNTTPAVESKRSDIFNVKIRQVY